MPTAQELIEEMIGIIEKRRHSYGSVLVRSAIVNRGDVWENSVTKILPLHRSDSHVPKEKLDYRGAIFFEELISLDRLLEIIGKLSEKGTSSISLGNYKIQFDVESFSDGHEYDSGDDYLNVGWYFETYHYRSSRRSYRREPLVLKDLPLFPDFRTALKEYIGIDVEQYSLYGVVICLPKYGAKIEEVNIGSAETRLRIQAKDVPIEKIMAKIHCERGKELRHLDVEFKDSTGIANIGFKPESMYIALVSTTNSDLLDSRRYYASWRLPKDFVIDTPEYAIEELIRNGETDTVEFKERIGKPKEFVETAVAFANSKGGVILLGVDDHFQIVDLPEENYKDKITNLLRSHCEPQVDFEVNKRAVGDKDIVVMRVEEGSVQDKPYFVRDKGPYIRANATDRIASRYELDEIYGQKRSTFGAY